MKVWMVFITIKEPTAGAPRTTARTTARWLDSQWARKQAAEDRVKDITASMRQFDCYRPAGSPTGASPDIVEGSVTDVCIVEPNFEGAFSVSETDHAGTGSSMLKWRFCKPRRCLRRNLPRW